MLVNSPLIRFEGYFRPRARRPGRRDGADFLGPDDGPGQSGDFRVSPTFFLVLLGLGFLIGTARPPRSSRAADRGRRAADLRGHGLPADRLLGLALARAATPRSRCASSGGAAPSRARASPSRSTRRAAPVRRCGTSLARRRAWPARPARAAAASRRRPRRTRAPTRSSARARRPRRCRRRARRARRRRRVASAASSTWMNENTPVPLPDDRHAAPAHVRGGGAVARVVGARARRRSRSGAPALEPVGAEHHRLHLAERA